jgi:hypothetical protein
MGRGQRSESTIFHGHKKERSEKNGSFISPQDEHRTVKGNPSLETMADGKRKTTESDRLQSN